MANSSSADTCLTWMADEQLVHEQSAYGANRKAVEDALKEQQKRTRIVRDYGKDLKQAVSLSRDDEMKATLNESYENLTVTANKRLECLVDVAEISKLESAFGTLSINIADCATSLVSDTTLENGDGPVVAGTGKAAQTCILAVRDNWQWLSTLVKCSETHLQHATEYHQFYHDAKEYAKWMPADLKKAEFLLHTSKLDLPQVPDGPTVNKVFFDLKAALSLFLHWQYKVDDLFSRSKTIIPVHDRSTRLDHFRPIKSLCDYKTKEISIRKGEELTLLDNTNKNSWVVRNIHFVETSVPSVIFVIPPPDVSALQAAMKLRLGLLGTWTLNLKRIGKSVIAFMLTILREWTDEEEKLISALEDNEKEDVRKMLDGIQSVLEPYWTDDTDYQILSQRMERLRWLLDQEGDKKFKEEAAKRGKVLIIQVAIINDLVRYYKDLWKHWEMYKVFVESVNHPELMLVCDCVDKMKFINFSEVLKKWHLKVDDDADGGDGKDKQDGNQVLMEEEIQEEVVQQEMVGNLDAMPNGENVEGNTYNIETARETAEADSLRTSEQEEKKTFIITGVVDTRTDEIISLDKAVAAGIINQSKGTYQNKATDESYPIPVAMNAGLIKVEFTTTKKSKEKSRDVGLITIKTQKESRPYTVKNVIDARTDRRLKIEEAVDLNILDLQAGTCKNTDTGAVLNLADALDSGLLIVEYDKDAVDVAEPEIVTKTYAVHAVVDLKAKTRVSFTEAVRKGLISQETGAYWNNRDNESIYVGDAIRRGFVKAVIVHDPNSMEIPEENRMVFDKFQAAKKKIMSLAAFKKAASKSGQ
ncbi:hypothetical protein CAPTEDRAFT_227872 [Capitella teleta]|uniref:Desmoplakin SH3 domain-containing protein n=1 Tax=Capitella teleta TaxID=283909 RepID=R7UER7_CAPTE|nr:hypothetical protein CAPTEDRAFT_227872 [Capitella teleta]|eukprot:ELU02288.1 hypothetical protein CAPTEDRAFT_227872 [Capitella teleta]